MKSKVLFTSVLTINLFMGCATLNSDTWSSYQKHVNRSKDVISGQDFDQNILSGTAVALGDREHYKVLQLRIDDENGFKTCTATRIGRDTLITAAHCVEKTSTEKVRVITIGPPQLPNSLNSYFEIAKIVIHPGYSGNPQQFNDLAVLKTKDTLPPYYKTAQLDKDITPIAQELEIFGFGITSEEARDSGSLRKITRKIDESVNITADRILIKQEGQKGGICRGDSGGPIFVKMFSREVLVGVSSFTTGDDAGKSCHGLGGFVRTRPNLAWIKDASSSVD